MVHSLKKEIFLKKNRNKFQKENSKDLNVRFEMRHKCKHNISNDINNVVSIESVKHGMTVAMAFVVVKRHTTRRIRLFFISFVVSAIFSHTRD